MMLTSVNPNKPESLQQQALCARAVLPSPLGDMTALATDQGLAALLFDGDKYHPDHHVGLPDDPLNPHIQAARHWLAAYWAGSDPDVDTISFDLAGTGFQRAVWQVLLRIKLGHTWTYGEVARQVSESAAPRATGGAIGRNPVAVLIPCHRVIGASGALTGYASGLPRKQRLLQHEKVLLL
jgi:methylated-DNA-[protein]-cysteine S-methyltransferase